jgi:hypothetical protein
MPPKSKGTGARPHRGKSQKDSVDVATPKTRRDASPQSPGGGIETLPDGGGYRATVEGRVIGTYATLQDAASAMTHAAMTPPASRATPRSRAKRSEPSHGVTTPEHAARTPLPGEARSDDAKSHPEKTLYGRRRDRNVFTRTFVMCAILAVTVALLDPNTTSTRFGALVSVARGGSPGEAETISTSCASDARFGAVAGLSPEEWRETSWLFLEAAREANARHAEETNPSSNPNPSRTRGLSSRKLGAKKGVALALIVETRLDAGPDAIAASSLRAAFGCDCVKVFDAKTYVALESPPDSSSGAAHVEEADEVEEESVRLRKREAEANARGALQKEVSAFLEKCPRGVAVIADAHRLTPPLLAALMPAVSEGGRFARDGRDVRADGATYVLVAALGGDFAAGEKGKYRVRGEVEYARAAKAELARLWRGEPFASDGNEALLTEAATGSGVTEAFRRRVDFVVPFRVRGLKED